jgi:protein-disulfide isomerase
MEKSNVLALAVVIGMGGFVVGSWDAKTQAHGPVMPAAATPAPEAAPAPTPEPAAAAPTPAPEVVAAAPSPVPSAPKPSSGSLDSQTDEGAGKGVDVTKLGSSPKDMNSPYLGPKDAAVVVNVFSDFQCPVCKRSADPIKQLAADFPGKVKVFFRNNALEMHGRSKPAALAAFAAKKQGKFWQYHDKLFATGALDDSSLEAAAKELGLNMEQWKKDVADPKSAERLAEESKWAESLGATGTPGFFVNGVRQVGWGSYMALKSMVGQEVQKAEEQKGAPAKTVLAERIKATAAKNPKGDSEKEPINPEKWAQLLSHD